MRIETADQITIVYADFLVLPHASDLSGHRFEQRTRFHQTFGLYRGNVACGRHRGLPVSAFRIALIAF